MPPTAATPRDNPPSAPDRLRALLAGEGCLSMPCCFDALSARLIEQAGFPLTFMSGFAVSATRLALPDTGLITVSEMLDQGRAICQAVRSRSSATAIPATATRSTCGARWSSSAGPVSPE